MRKIYIPIYDYRDPECPPDYDLDAEVDAYLDECERREISKRES